MDWSSAISGGFSVGRESAYVFHLAKRAVTPMLLLTWALYLSMPVSIHPAIVILPFAVLFCLLPSAQCRQLQEISLRLAKSISDRKPRQKRPRDVRITAGLLSAIARNRRIWWNL